MISKLKNKRILISGASIAGPALAFWLRRYGFTVTVVEQAPILRLGGYKIDTRGKSNDVLKAMGLYEQVLQCAVDTKFATFVDDEGKTVIEMEANQLGMREKGDVELLRGDLANILYQATCHNCEYIFNDSIKSVKQTDDDIEVDFVKRPSRKFDFLIGADGIHSNVRSLVFGEESKYLYDLGGYYFSFYTVDNHLKLEGHEMFYSKNNKQINISSTKANEDVKVIYIFRDTDWKYNYRDVKAQKEELIKIYKDLKWETPYFLSAMDKATDFYFDAARQVRMEAWTKDRTVLIGDAAYSPSLTSGQGSSVALVGAYILAGELFASAGDYKKAFSAYEKQMRGYIKANQALGETVMNLIIAKPKTKLQSLVAKLKSYLLPKDYDITKLRNQFRYTGNCITLKNY